MLAAKSKELLFVLEMVISAWDHESWVEFVVEAMMLLESSCCGKIHVLAS